MAALYIDDRASKEQTDSLTIYTQVKQEVFLLHASNLIGKALGVKSVPIEFGIDENVVGCISKIYCNLK